MGGWGVERSSCLTSAFKRRASHTAPRRTQEVKRHVWIITAVVMRPAVHGSGNTDLMLWAITASTGAQGAAAEITLPGTPESVPIARRLVRDALPGCPRADDLMLAVSEFASNTITWSLSGQRGTFTVRVRTAPRWARVEVTDDGPAKGSSSGGNGWGLKIVAAVTDRSGATIEPDGRRKAWGEVTWCP